MTIHISVFVLKALFGVVVVPLTLFIFGLAYVGWVVLGR